MYESALLRSIEVYKYPIVKDIWSMRRRGLSPVELINGLASLWGLRFIRSYSERDFYHDKTAFVIIYGVTSSSTPAYSSTHWMVHTLTVFYGEQTLLKALYATDVESYTALIACESKDDWKHIVAKARAAELIKG